MEFPVLGTGGRRCRPARRVRAGARSGPQADPAFTPTLTSSVASLPFLGNRLVGLSFVPNALTPADTTAAYEVGLRRQSDCSLDEDFILPGITMPRPTTLPRSRARKIISTNWRG